MVSLGVGAVTYVPLQGLGVISGFIMLAFLASSGETEKPRAGVDLGIVVPPVDVEDVERAERVQLPTVGLCIGPYGVPRG